MKKKPIYWITDRVTETHREKANLLSQRGFGVEFFTVFDKLAKLFADKRVAIVVVGDEGSAKDVEAATAKLMNMPESNGVRFILSLSKPNPILVQLACANGFRDVIALDLEPNRWLQRFLFSTAGTAVVLPQPVPQMTLKNISAVSLPARIGWVSSKRIWVESRVTPPVGSKIKLTGRFAHAMGMKVLTLTVEECQKTNLRYRFSDAFVCSWSVPESQDGKKKILLDHLAAFDVGAACKAFVAIQSPALRATLLSYLKPPHFEVSTALHKQSLIDEPKYLNPHIVFIDEKLCTSQDYTRFHEMIASLEVDVPIVIVGAGGNIEELREIAQGRKVILLQRIPVNLTEVIFKKYLRAKKRHLGQADDGAIHLTAENEYSIAELNFAARLTRIHPSAAQLALPYPVGNFGLLRIDSPFIKKFLGRTPFAKVTDSYDDKSSSFNGFPYLIDCCLIDTLQRERQNLARELVNVMAHQLTVLPSAAPKLPKSDVETPTFLVTPSAVQEQTDLTLTDTFSQPSAPHSDVILSTNDFVESARVNVQRERVATTLPRKKRKQTVGDMVRSDGLLYVAVFFAFTALAAGFIGYGFEFIAPYVKKSGSDYSSQLKKFQHVDP